MSEDKDHLKELNNMYEKWKRDKQYEDRHNPSVSAQPKKETPKKESVTFQPEPDNYISVEEFVSHYYRALLAYLEASFPKNESKTFPSVHGVHVTDLAASASIFAEVAWHLFDEFM